MCLDTLLCQLEEEIRDPEEETFLLYSQPILSQNLGFIDRTAQSVEVTLHGRDYTIYQSPGLLSSSRAGGTTGAVLWKVAPLFAEWFSSSSNPLSTHDILSPSTHILELGCGISPLTGLTLLPRIRKYTLTDQPYIQRLLQQNLSANPLPKSKKSTSAPGEIEFRALDWETDQATVSALGTPDIVLATDCVFNYALVKPFVQSCVDVCRLKEVDADGRGCLCVVAQQLRNDEVFRDWLTEFHRNFRVWRIPDGMLPKELKTEAGFVVHLGILRTE